MEERTKEHPKEKMVEVMKFFKKQEETFIQDAIDARIYTNAMLQSNLRVALNETLRSIQWAAQRGSSSVYINSIWYNNGIATWKNRDKFDRDLIFPIDQYESKMKELGFTLSNNCDPSLVITW